MPDTRDSRHADAREYLTLMLGRKPEHLHALIWTAPAKQSLWVAQINTWDALAEQVVALGDTSDTYLGMGWAIQDYGAKRRAKATEVAGIAGFWSDIDLAGPAHKKANLPPTLEAALHLLDRDPDIPQVTFYVHSGHGLHAYWLFDQPWIFHDSGERQTAMLAVRRWHARLKDVFAREGWELDAVSDLSRVLRVPGSLNHKLPDDVRPVTLEIVDPVDGAWYRPDDFTPGGRFTMPVPVPGEPAGPHAIQIDSPAVEAATRILSGEDTGDGTGVAIDITVQPPFEKWDALQDSDVKVRLSWERKRKDLGDQSPSSYDMSLASFAAAARWTDAEITALLVQHRRKHGDDLKRPDYYERTIRRARTDIEKAHAADIVEDISAGEGPADPDERKRVALVALSKLFEMEVVGLIEYDYDPARYRLEARIEGRTKGIMLGESSTLCSQQRMRERIFQMTKHALPDFKSAEWRRIVNVMGRCVTTVDVGDDATEEGTARGWLSDYLVNHPVLEDRTTALQQQQPFIEEGAVHVMGLDLRRWLRASAAEKLSSKEMGTTLRMYGCVPTTFPVDIGDLRTTRQVWRVPPEKFPPPSRNGTSRHIEEI